jgi:1-phosphatidylinositol-4-phosphate 5-kinase
MVEPAVHTYVDALPAMPPKSPLPGSARGPLPPLGHLPDTGSCHSARVAGTYNLLHPFTRRGNFQIRHGEVIFKGHRSYHLMMQIKAGVRYTVERQDALASRNLCMADFRATSTVRFPTLGSADTPPIEKGFTFKDYAPMVFRHLRQRYGITAASYLRSLCGQEALREATTPGKSGSLFYYSSDDRFILKTLSKQEATVLLSILPQYYFHMMKNPESLITRFFGLHRITTHRLGLRRRRIRIVVMSNFLPTRTPIHLRYDLKGSTYGRFSRTSASLTSDQPPDDCSQPSAPRRRPSLLWRAQESDPRQPRKDLDLFRDGIGPISIDRRLRRRMLNQIDMDCLFLESVHIMDYSFLLGLHRIETPTSAPASTDLRRASTDAMAKSGNSWIGLLNNGEQARLFFGIIDVLDRYNTEKQLEHCWKARMLCLHNTISVIEPSSYARRFRGFLEKTFLPLPRTPQSAAPVGSKSEFVP